MNGFYRGFILSNSEPSASVVERITLFVFCDCHGFPSSQVPKVTYMLKNIRQNFRGICGVILYLDFMRRGESIPQLMVHIVTFIQNTHFSGYNQCFTYYFQNFLQYISHNCVPLAMGLIHPSS